MDMAHSRGFEPLTARFVAEYSIQLSYECVKNDLTAWKQGMPSRARMLFSCMRGVKKIPK